jgi:hypothetical protein
VATKRTSLVLVDPRIGALSAIRSCASLEDVLALEPAPRLVAQLFGETASKTLINPLSDAILRGLTNTEDTIIRQRHARTKIEPVKQKTTPSNKQSAKTTSPKSESPEPKLPVTHSGIALASAASGLLDPTRLAAILSWDDSGFDLIPTDAPEDFIADLAAVFGNYRDPKRRLALMWSLWTDVKNRNDDRAKVTGFLRETQRLARHQIAETPSFVMDTFRNASKTMPIAEAATMCFEHHVQAFVRAEANLVNWASIGRAAEVDLVLGMGRETNRVSAKKITNAAVRFLIDGARLRHAVTHLVSSLPTETKRGEVTRHHPRLLRRHFWMNFSAEAESLIRFAAGYTHTDAELLMWSDDVRIYSGASSSVSLQREPGMVPTVPRPALTLPAAVAQVAQLVRFGATLPAKPSSWPQLLAEVCAPYYVHQVVAIDTPTWVNELHGKPLDATGLVAKAPKDMAELSRWANHMGNCIASIYGDDVGTGKRVILGLFRDDELLYNVGINATTQRIWEVNSRFNNDDVPQEVIVATHNLVDRLHKKVISPTEKDPRVPKEKSASTKKPKLTAAAGEQIAFIANELKIHQWDPVADLSVIADRLGIAVDTTAQHSHWLNLVTAIDRFEPTQTLDAFRLALGAKQFTRGWDLLTTHPLDALTHVGDVNQRDRTVRLGLDLIRQGDERAKLARTEKMLEDPALDGAWRLAKLQKLLMPAVRDLVTKEPRALVAILRGPANARARWALALAFVARADYDESLLTLHNTVPFELRDPDQIRQAWREAALVDVEAVARLRVESGINDTNEADFALLRAERELPPIRCPRVWLNAAR